MNRAWGIAGLSTVCKTVRAGFNSLPRLHFVWDKDKRVSRYFGVNLVKAERLFDLLNYHHDQSVEAHRKAAILTDKSRVLSKNLSAYKRHFGPLPSDIAERLPAIKEVDADWSGEMTGFRKKL